MEETRPLTGMTSPHVNEHQVQHCYYGTCDQQREETGSCHQTESLARTRKHRAVAVCITQARHGSLARSLSLSLFLSVAVELAQRKMPKLPICPRHAVTMTT